MSQDLNVPPQPAPQTAIPAPAQPAAQPAQPVVVPPAPEPTVPAKFLNADGTPNVSALVQSYNQLETRLGAPAPEPQQPAGAPQPPSPGTFSPDVLRPYLAEYAQSGDLSAGSKALLAQQYGLPEGAIAPLMQGAAAQAQLQEASILQASGLDRQQYEALTSWAQQNMAPHEIAAYNKAVNSGDPDAAVRQIKDLHLRHTQAQQGPAGDQLIGSQVSGGLQQGFTTSEMTKAMSDPRYGKDRQYTEAVNAKTVASELPIETKIADGGMLASQMGQ